MADSAISASAKGASFLILLQIGSRALTFALNQVLLRFLSPSLLGTAVQLELYCISVLYFARESIRVALQRRADGVQAVINLSYLAIGVGIPLVIVLAELYLRTDVPNVPNLVLSLRLYGIAALVELLSEPGFVAAQQKLMYKVRAAAEAAATVAKTFATVGFVLWANRQDIEVGVLPFAVGQMAYAVTLFLVYSVKVGSLAGRGGFSLLPRRISDRTGEPYILSLFYKPLLTLSLSLSIQSTIKYVLTQGDSILITTLASLQDQGAYALSSNYGGLIARMLFQPIEEASRNLFAKICASTPSTDVTTTKAETKAERPSVDKVASEGITKANTILTTILKFYSLISLIAFSIGPPLAPVLLQVVAGSKWSATGAGSVLGAYTYYIPLLAINGVTEAFVAAVATNTELYIQSVWMGGFFVAFASSAYLFLRVLEMGARGLVWANCVNMAARIVFNITFIKHFFAKHGRSFDLLTVLPSASSIAITSTIPFLIRSTDGMLTVYGIIGEIARLGGLTGVLVIAIAVIERQFIMDCVRMVKQR